MSIKVSEVVKRYKLNEDKFVAFVYDSGVWYKNGFSGMVIDDADVEALVEHFTTAPDKVHEFREKMLKAQEQEKQEIATEERKQQYAIPDMLMTQK